MITITLPPELEQVVTERAKQQGTTPELVALDTLRKELLPVASPPPIEGQTLVDFLGEFIGCIHSSEMVPGGAQMSVDTGKKFAAGMVKKRREGRL
ncbi:MAG TPA: hypothetical protein VFA07_14850 [Chthonomonadaceae bacterium]|nr:hypothetical protein [Chthonomonadaceae bacterium]